MRFFLEFLISLVVIPKVVEAQTTNTIISYNVISLLNASESMGVVVDNVTYPMSLNSTNGTDILYSGDAPVAKSNYRYVRFFSNHTNVTEPFDRQPSDYDTSNEFFNRTWNTYDISRLPIIYPPLPAIHRIKTDLHTAGQIPTIHLVGNQTLLDQMHQNSTEDFSVITNVSYVGLKDVFSFKKAELSLSGRSSRWLPKLSYNLKFADKDTLYTNQRVKLRSLSTDPSYIREQLAYDMVNCTGLASSGFSFIRVFMNNYELGLFGIIETFHDTWIADTFGDGDPKYNSGYLYQGVYQTPASAAQNLTSDLRYVDNITTYGLGQYQIKESAAKGKSVNWKPLMELTKFIATAPTDTSDAVSQWDSQLDTDSVLRSMALEVLLGYADGYVAMVDNWYVYQNLQTKKFFWIPSDMDLTFGSTMFKLEDMWSGNYSTFPGIDIRPLTMQILKVPEFQQTYNHLLIDISNTLVNPDKTHTYINDLVNMIAEDVAWDQTLIRAGESIMANVVPNSNENETTSVIESIVGNAIPRGMNIDTAENFASRINATIPFLTAVNGPTGYISLAGVMQWIDAIHQNITNFYSN